VTAAAPNIVHNIVGRPYEAILRKVGEIAENEGIEAYAVGGIVRDILLERATTDIDFVTIGAGTGIKLARAVAAVIPDSSVSVFKNFGTASVRLRTSTDDSEAVTELEFVASRRESYRRDSRKPIVEDGTLEDDQLRRDFSINAMAIGIIPKSFGDLIDPFGGISDLNSGVLRTPQEPVRTFDDDPLRILRAARFSAQLSFTIEENTAAAMKECSPRIEIVSAERISIELQKIVCSDTPSVGFIALYQAGMLEIIFPELVALQGVETKDGQKHKDNFFHTLEVLDNLVEMTRDRAANETHWLRWAALLHDIGKPRSKRFKKESGWTFHGHEEIGARMVPRLFKTMRLPTDDRMKYVQHLIRLHHRPVSLVDNSVTDSAVRRLVFDAGDAIDDLMTLVRADITSKNPTRVRRYLKAFKAVEQKMVDVEERDSLRNFQPPVSGDEIMERLHLAPGRKVGELKEAVRNAILDGLIPNDHDAAFAYLMDIKDEILRESGSK